MEVRPRKILNVVPSLMLGIALVICHSYLVRADISDSSTVRRGLGANRHLYDCGQCRDREEQGASVVGVHNCSDEMYSKIITTYSGASGDIKLGRVRLRDLSASWVWVNHSGGNHDRQSSELLKYVSLARHGAKVYIENSNDTHHAGEGGNQLPPITAMSPTKIDRKILRQIRRQQRTAELIQQDKETDDQIAAAAIQKAQKFDTTINRKYNIWRRESSKPDSDYTLRLMRDQIIMAKAYAAIAKSNNDTDLYYSLMKHSRGSKQAIGEAHSDAELAPSALARARAIGHALYIAKYRLYDCLVMSRKLRAMLQSSEENVDVLKKKSVFLIELAAKTVPKQLHCLTQHLAADYFMQGHQNKEDFNKEKLEDPSLYHYAIISDNVLATSVVVNSTFRHVKEAEKHVFHIVTDKLNFAAMRMWFLMNAPGKATIHVQNIDDFKWLNSSYCPVLRQLESDKIKDYYFNTSHPSSLSDQAENLKYRNPKYISMLNHLRFYLPEVHPKLEKILFLDDDIVVQKDLTPLWSIDLNGMVNGAVETCKVSFHRFDTYLNFSHPKISKNFDSNACGWAFGMNIFDLKEWRKQNITGIYHYWQDLNEDRTLWKLGSLPPGLITFYNLTYPLDRSWHVLGLGYNPSLNQTEIENAAVIHYNGNYKPWLDLASSKYGSYWSKYVMLGNPYLTACRVSE